MSDDSDSPQIQRLFDKKPHLQTLIKSLPDQEVMTRVAEAMKQLGDPTRLRIFWFVCHTEECVLNIATIVGMTSPAVSHHLRLLRTAGLVVARRQGKETYYKVADTQIAKILHHSMENVLNLTSPTEEDSQKHVNHAPRKRS